MTPPKKTSSYTLQVLSYGPDRILKVKVNMARPKVKLRSHHDISITLNQCPYQVSTFYTLLFLRYRLDKIFKLKVATPRLNQSHTMTLYTYTPLTNVCTIINFLHLTVSEIQPRQSLLPTRPDTMGGNNTCT